MEGSITADYRRLYGLRLGSFAGAATLAAVRPVWIGSVSIAGVAALVEDGVHRKRLRSYVLTCC